MTYSLTKRSGNIISWYKKRYVRILLPYSMIAVPWFLIVTIMEHHSWIDFLFDVSTLSYWLYHRGAWFIAALIPLYLITPLLFKLLIGNKYRLVCLLCLLMFTIILGSIDIDGVLGNIVFVVKRLPCYFCGIFIAQYVASKISISCIYGSVVVLFFALFIKFIGGWWWPLIFLALALVCKIIEYIPILKSIFKFMGVISLESYIMNICLSNLYNTQILRFLCYNNGLKYAYIVILGTIIAVIINRLALVFSRRICP